MRRPYSRWCRFHTSPDAPLVRVRWFFTDLPFQAHESIINSLDWEENPHNNTLVGEQDFDDWEYNGAEHVPGLLGGHECGTISDFESGQDWPYTGPPIEYGADFIPLCCPRDLGGDAVAGASADYLSTPPYVGSPIAGASADYLSYPAHDSAPTVGAQAARADELADAQVGAQAARADELADAQVGAQAARADELADAQAGTQADNAFIPFGHTCETAEELPTGVIYNVVSELSETGDRWAKFPVTEGETYYVKYVEFGNGQTISWYEGTDCSDKVFIHSFGGPTPQCLAQEAAADGFVFVKITFDVILPGSGFYEWGYGDCPL